MKLKILLLFLVILGSTTQIFAQKYVRLINRGHYVEAQSLIVEKMEKIRKNQKNQGSHYKWTPKKHLQRINLHYSLSKIHNIEGNYVKAIANLKKADSAYTDFKSSIYSKTLYNTLLGSFIDVKGPYYSWVAVKQDVKYFTRQTELSMLNIKLGEMEVAKSNIDKANKAMRGRFGKKSAMGTSFLTTLAEYYLNKSMFDSSQFYYEKSIITLRSDPNYFDRYSIKKISDAYYGLAQSLLGKHELETALLAAKASYKYAKHRFVKVTDGRNYFSKIATSNLIAEIYRRQNNYTEAIIWSDKAIAIYNNGITVLTPQKLPLLATRGQIFWALSDTLNSNYLFRELTNLFFSYTQNNFSYLPEQERNYIFRNNKHFLELAKGYYQYLYFQNGFTEDYIGKAIYEISLNNKGVLLNSASKLLNAIYNKGDSSLLGLYSNIQELKEKRSGLLQSGRQKEIHALDIEIANIETTLRSSLAIDTDGYINIQDIIRSIPDSTNFIDIVKCKEYKLNKALDDDSVMILTESHESRYLYFIMDNSTNFKLLTNELNDKELDGRLFKAYMNFAKSNILNATGYIAYFEPLVKYLKYRNIIISSDGIYNILNPEILFDGNSYLIDKYNFQSITSGRDLLESDSKRFVLTDITLIGWPDYTTHMIRYGKQPPDIPGTGSEIKRISKIIPSTIPQYQYLRGSANELQIKDIPSTTILHLATHGFFDTSSYQEPLYSSGLILAISDQNNSQEDGYLTAYEASNLDLQRTSLVVLSACETGQGEFEDGEGVWGLQRAFQVAGVRYIVMSLFKVDDDITSMLMQYFYTNIVNGDQVSPAFRKAQLKIKSEFINPTEWGSFILKGI